MALTDAEELELLKLQEEEYQASRTAGSSPQKKEGTFADLQKQMRMQNTMADQATSFGFLDEVESAAGGAWDALTSDESFSDSYTRRHDAKNKEMQEWSSANPGLAMSSAVTGSAPLLPLSTALAGPKLAASAEKGAKALRYGRQALTATGEGALYGVGSGSGAKDRAEKAGVAALFGLGSKLGIAAAGVSVKAMLKFRGDMMDAGLWTPINLSNPDSALGGAYKTFVSNMPFSGVRKQTSDVADVGLTEAKKVIADKKAATLKAKTAATNYQARLTEARKNVRAKQDAALAAEATGNKRLTSSLAAQEQKTAQQAAMAAVDTANQEFRDVAAATSTPQSMAPDAVASLKGKPPLDVNKSLSEAWKDGFGMVKNRDFKVDPDEILKNAMDDIDTQGLKDHASEITAIIKNKLHATVGTVPNPRLAGIPKHQHEQVAKAGKFPERVSSGVITGADLMESRNALRLVINDMSNDSGSSAIKIEAFRRAAKEIDDVIEKQLKAEGGDELVNAFKAERESWGNATSFKDSSLKAVDARQGMFEPKDYLQTKKIAQPRRASQGDAPNQRAAMTAQNEIDAAKARAEQVKASSVMGEKQTKQVIDDTKAAEKLAITKARNLADRNRASAATPAIVADTTAAEAAEAGLTKGVPSNENIFGVRAAMTIPMIAASTTGLPVLPAAVASAGTGPALGRKVIQRALQGQTKKQQALSRALRGPDALPKLVKPPAIPAGARVSPYGDFPSSKFLSSDIQAIIDRLRAGSAKGTTQ